MSLVSMYLPDTKKNRAMPTLPTRLELFIRTRINLRIFGIQIGTGHFISGDTDTESESSEDEGDQGMT